METLEQMADLETIDQNTKLVKIESDHANNKYPQYLRNVREATGLLVQREPGRRFHRHAGLRKGVRYHKA